MNQIKFFTKKKKKETEKKYINGNKSITR